MVPFSRLFLHRGIRSAISTRRDSSSSRQINLLKDGSSSGAAAKSRRIGGVRQNRNADMSQMMVSMNECYHAPPSGAFRLDARLPFSQKSVS